MATQFCANSFQKFFLILSEPAVKSFCSFRCDEGSSFPISVPGIFFLVPNLCNSFRTSANSLYAKHFSGLESLIIKISGTFRSQWQAQLLSKELGRRISLFFFCNGQDSSSLPLSEKSYAVNHFLGKMVFFPLFASLQMILESKHAKGRKILDSSLHSHGFEIKKTWDSLSVEHQEWLVLVDGHLPTLPGDWNLPNSEVLLAPGRITACVPGVWCGTDRGEPRCHLVTVGRHRILAHW